PDGQQPKLNRLFLRKGRLPAPGDHNEVVIGEIFAKSHGLGPGDTLTAIVYGAREELRIVGIVLSPDFVFETRPGEAMPDNRRFGVFWMSERRLSTAFNLRGAFNNVLATVAPGANRLAVMAEIDRLLAPYGGQPAYDRENHASA